MSTLRHNALLSCACLFAVVLIAQAQEEEKTVGFWGYALSWLSWKFGFRTNPHHETYEDAETIPTIFGPMQAFTFGEKSDKVALTIHGGADVEAIHREFEPLAHQLANKQGYYVISPNFHSIKATHPRALTKEEMERMCIDLLKWVGAEKYTLVMGKGWGGAMAARLAAMNPELMDKVVFIAAGPLREDVHPRKDMIIPIPSLMLYAVDDASVNRDVMRRIREVSPKMMRDYHGAYRGGHGILKDYVEEILYFARRAFDEDEEDDEPPPAESGGADHEEL